MAQANGDGLERCCKKFSLPPMAPSKLLIELHEQRSLEGRPYFNMQNVNLEAVVLAVRA